MGVCRANKFPHPYERLNSKRYTWVDEKVWYYRRKFDLPTAENKDFVFLCFDGIDYFARVWLNGKLLGRHEGMFGGPAIEIGNLAHLGGANDLVVEVKAGNWGHKTDWKPRGPEGAVVKPWVIAGGTGGEMFFPLGMWRGRGWKSCRRGISSVLSCGRKKPAHARRAWPSKWKSSPARTPCNWIPILGRTSSSTPTATPGPQSRAGGGSPCTWH